MKRLFFVTAVAALLMPVVSVAQSAFNGTWKVNMSNVDFPRKPNEYLLKGGMYTCKTCTPPYTINANGTDQPVTGHPYYDTVAIEVVNDHEVKETDKKDGKIVATATTTISPDGNTATVEFSDATNTNGGPPVTGKGEAVRIAKGPAKSNAISGAWRTTRIEGVSDNGVTTTYQVNGDEITMSTPTGQSYTAKLNGTESPMKGDPGVSAVKVKLIGTTTLEETDLRDGRVIGVFKMAIAGDGSVAHASYTDARLNRTTQFEMTKQ
jgi:hypothetical protein